MPYLTTAAVLALLPLLAMGQTPRAAEPTTEAGGAPGFSPQRVGFAVRYGDELSDYATGALFALPAERLPVEVIAKAGSKFSMLAAAGSVESVGEHSWIWQAPAASGYAGSLHIRDVASGETIRLNTFVLVPFGELDNGYLGRFRVGDYPDPDRLGVPINYDPPRGFLRVTRATQHVKVSPHFRVGQFLCKQAGGWPKFVVPDTRLYLKLENVLEAVNKAGYDVDTLYVMSGFRTPYYNEAIDNVTYSRHIYGDAADIFVDANLDQRMDDLNDDGVSDYRDAVLLASLVEGLSAQHGYMPLTGGLGTYGTAKNHGPFIHVDTRGVRARWNSTVARSGE